MALMQRSLAFSSVSPLAMVPAKIRMVLQPRMLHRSTHSFTEVICSFNLAASGMQKLLPTALPLISSPSLVQKALYLGKNSLEVSGK